MPRRGRRRRPVRPGVGRRRRGRRSSTGARRPTVLTPHDGEFGLLAGHRPAADRFQAARRLAADLRARRAAQGSGHDRRRPDGDVLVVGQRRRPPRHGRHGRRAVRASSARSLATGLDPLRGRGVGGLAARRGGSLTARPPGSSPATSSRPCPTVLRAHCRDASIGGSVGLGRDRSRRARPTTSACSARPRAPAGVWAVVKADAYGHGAVAVGAAALDAGCDGLCVALGRRGRGAAAGRDRRRRSSCSASSRREHAATIVAHGLTPTVTTLEALDAPGARSAVGPRRPPQGRHRDAPRRRRRRATSAALVARIAAASPSCGCAGVFTHLAVRRRGRRPAIRPSSSTAFDEVLAALAAGGARRDRRARRQLGRRRWRIPRARRAVRARRHRDVRHLAGCRRRRPAQPSCGRCCRCKARVSFVKRLPAGIARLVRPAPRAASTTPTWRRCRSATPTACRRGLTQTSADVLIGGQRRRDRRRRHDGPADGRLSATTTSRRATRWC